MDVLALVKDRGADIDSLKQSYNASFPLWLTRSGPRLVQPYSECNHDLYLGLADPFFMDYLWLGPKQTELAKHTNWLSLSLLPSRSSHLLAWWCVSKVMSQRIAQFPASSKLYLEKLKKCQYQTGKECNGRSEADCKHWKYFTQMEGN